MTQLTPNFDAVDLPENASWEDYIDWRSEHERASDNSKVKTAEALNASFQYHSDLYLTDNALAQAMLIDLERLLNLFCNADTEVDGSE